MSAKSVLIIKNDGIGDLVLASGLITRISEYVDGNLDLITCIQNKDIALRIDGVRDIYFISRDDLKIDHLLAKIGLIKTYITRSDKKVLDLISRNEYDICICLRRFIRQSSLIIMNFVNASHKYCFWQIPTNASMGQAVKFSMGWKHITAPWEIQHELEYYWRVCSGIFDNLGKPKPTLQINSSVQTVHPRTIAVAIGGATVNLDPEKWFELIKKISEYGWKVHFYGGPAQAQLAKDLSAKIDNVLSLVNKYSLSEVLDKLAKYEYFLGVDTGLAHMAAITVPHQMILTGGGTFLRFVPWPDSKKQHVLFYKMDCFDCGWDCKYSVRHCLNNLSVELIFRNLVALLNSETIPQQINLNPMKSKYKLAWRQKYGYSLSTKELLIKYYNLVKTKLRSAICRYMPI